MKYFKISQIQFEGKSTPYENAEILENYFKKTLKFKPDLITTPECSNIITGDNIHLIKHSNYQSDCPVLKMAKSFAKLNKVNINIGSLLLKQKNKKKLINRSFIIDKVGSIKKYYDKIHMFDVEITSKEKYRESSTFSAGNKIAYINLDNIKIGLTICYDLRFPNLYRFLAKKGVQIVLIPAAFTVPTGKAHWQSLNQARAIENNIFVAATGMCGKHHSNRKTYGHSLIISPWGKIINKLDSKAKILNTRINIQEVIEARKKIPSLLHD